MIHELKNQNGPLLHVLPAFRKELLRECDLFVIERETSGDLPRLISHPEAIEFCRQPKAGEPSVGLFEIPVHLIRRWYQLVESSSNIGTGSKMVDETGYRRFAEAVFELFRFKRVPLPEHCQCDATVLPNKLSEFCVNTWEQDSPPDSGAFSGIVINLGPDMVLLQLPLVPQNSEGGYVKQESADPDKFGQLIQIRIAPREGVFLSYVERFLLRREVAAADKSVVLFIHGGFPLIT